MGYWPNDTRGPQDLVDRHVKELDSEYEDDDEEDDAAEALQDKEVNAHSQLTVNFSQEVRLDDSQRLTCWLLRWSSDRTSAATA